MLVGIISDSHDNIWNLEKALNKLKNLQITALIHCGDLCAPFIVSQLEKLQIPVHVVFGNIDDRDMTPKLCEGSEWVKHYGDAAEISVGNRKIAFTHFPLKAEEYAKSGNFDAVFHGHTHKRREERIGKTLLVNPGEIMGRLKNPGFAVYDTDRNAVEFYSLN